MTAPLVGRAEDFSVAVMTELGAEVKDTVLDHVSMDDDHLAKEAIDLPQLIFYYSAAYSRAYMREEQSKMKVKRAEAQAFVAIKNAANANGDKIPVDEVNARIAIDPVVQKAQDDLIEIQAKRQILKGVLDALERKGFSLGVVGNIRTREEDWLRRSFADRFTGHPKQDEIAKVINTLLGANLVR
jgi:hypothetical protein